MKLRPNLTVAVIIAIIHFGLGLGSALMGASEATSPTGGNGSWLAPTYLFTFPLTMIFELLHKREGFGFGGNVLAMMVQSFCWGLLISLMFPEKKTDA
jgi:hypothetical protein